MKCTGTSSSSGSGREAEVNTSLLAFKGHAKIANPLIVS